MNPWKALVLRYKAGSVSPVPPGWLNRSQVADKLGCSEERVNENLRSAIKNRDVLVDKFDVWDAVAQKVLKVQYYCINTRKDKKDTPDKVSRQKWPFPEGTQVRRKDGGSGVVISGNRVQWDSGSITAPKGRTIEKIVAV